MLPSVFRWSLSVCMSVCVYFLHIFNGCRSGWFIFFLRDSHHSSENLLRFIDIQHHWPMRYICDMCEIFMRPINISMHISWSYMFNWTIASSHDMLLELPLSWRLICSNDNENETSFYRLKLNIHPTYSKAHPGKFPLNWIWYEELLNSASSLIW